MIMMMIIMMMMMMMMMDLQTSTSVLMRLSVDRMLRVSTLLEVTCVSVTTDTEDWPPTMIAKVNHIIIISLWRRRSANVLATSGRRPFYSSAFLF